MSPDHTLSTGTTALFGSLGGLVAFIVVFALPELRNLYRNFVMPSRPKLVVALLIAVGNVVIGGVAALLLGDATEARQAIAYGISAQAILGSLIRA